MSACRNGFMKRFFYIICIIGLVLTSCSTEDDCHSGPLDIITLEDLGCDVPAYQLSIKSSNEFELIRNQEQYLSLLSSPCRPKIDWEVYDMIAGTLNIPNGLLRLEHAADYNCMDNKLSISIMVFLNESTVALPVGFAFIIPKLNDTETPYVNIAYQ